MLIEVLEKEIADRINTILMPYDYLFYYIDENKGLEKVDTISPRQFYNFLICTPKIASEHKFPL